MKQYPSLQDYNLAVENLAVFGRIDLLRQAVPARGTGNRMIAYSGGYSRVYRVQQGGRPYALRCWTAEVPEVRERYRTIGGFLRATRPAGFVEFAYHDDALLVRGTTYPVLWMEWVEGETLRAFLSRHMGQPAVLRALADEFLLLVRRLHALGMSHGDLQDENILVQPGPGGRPSLRLIDYDSMFVPGLEGFSSPITGIAAYQHPNRRTLARAGPQTDYFSELVIYLSLRILAVQPDLWDPHGDKYLVFREQDYADPAASALLRHFRGYGGDIGRLAQTLHAFSRAPDLASLEPLEQVVGRLARLPDDFLQVRRPAPPPHPTTPVDDFTDWLPATGAPAVPARRVVPVVGMGDDFLPVLT